MSNPVEVPRFTLFWSRDSRTGHAETWDYVGTHSESPSILRRVASPGEDPDELLEHLRVCGEVRTALQRIARECPGQPRHSDKSVLGCPRKLEHGRRSEQAQWCVWEGRLETGPRRFRNLGHDDRA